MKVVWFERRQIMVNSIFEKIDFWLYKDYHHFFK